MWRALDRLDGSNALSAALATQDAVAGQRIVRELTLGSGDA